MGVRAVLVFALISGACGGNGSSDVDAASSVDAATNAADAAISPDGRDPLNWVDFTITGCESGSTDLGDGGIVSTCAGAAPLSLSFTALAPAAIEVYLWTFGDGGETSSPSPTHIYESPGTYDVSLVVGGPGGTANVTRPGAVVVRAAELGSPCADSVQCGANLSCACDGNTNCDAVLPNGLCTADCNSTTPCGEGVCADLAPTAPGSPADWERTVCLIECDDDTGCPAGLTCQELVRGDAAGWVKGCFAPGVLRPIGESCADADGDPDDALCATGSCLDLGVRGVCSIACSGDDCPESSACATFTDGAIGSQCVARCGAPSQCTADPWLACEAPGGSGMKAFTVDESPDAAGYCAPKTCTGIPDECGPDGTCTDGFCEPG